MRFQKLLLFLILAALLAAKGAAHADPSPSPASDGWTQKQQRLVRAYKNEFEEPGRYPAAAQDPEAPLPEDASQPRADSRDSIPVNIPGLPKPGLQDASSVADKPSALEALYSKRAGGSLRQFGYDMFGVPQEETQKKLDSAAAQNAVSPPMGAVQDDFMLASGDELEIVFTGQRTDRALYTVNSQGMVLISDFPPVPAAGRTIAQVRLSIRAAAQNLHDTQAYVALASVRQIAVLIAGHVRRPGRQVLTVFHTVLDALMQAGGVDKGGSLRQIRLVRAGRSTLIDIYGLLLGNNAALDLALRDGDRIIVPPVGPTLAVSGEVKRPGIFEIRPGETLSLPGMLGLAGGVLSPGSNRFLRLAVGENGQEHVVDVKAQAGPLFAEGAVLMVERGSDRRAGMVDLEGHTRRPGLYALEDNPSLKALLASEDVLGPEIYPLIGVIRRWDPVQLTHRLIGFPLRVVLKGDYDRKLQDGDEVRLFSGDEINALFDGGEKTIPIEDDEGAPVKKIDESMAGFLRERAAFVRGAVRRPGAYPVAVGVTLDSLLAAAGGLSIEANRGNIEITGKTNDGPQDGNAPVRRLHVDITQARPQDVPVGPGDAVRVNESYKKIEDKSVLLTGEVAIPGRYDLIPGDKMSDLLERVGGFTPQAYPEGAIFSRRSERLAEEARFRSEALQIKQAVAAAVEDEGSGKDKEKINSAKIGEARALAQELENAQGVGRITVETDPQTLKAHPELDMLLEAGDRIYIPKRALSVRVSGEVLSPATLQFRQDKAPRDYIDEAGGLTYNADESRAFVLFPNGSARPLGLGFWSHSENVVPPGSTIIVPRDPEPFDFIQSAKDISQILSNLAITAIFVDDVKNGRD